jgi:hypothetical protein
MGAIQKEARIGGRTLASAFKQLQDEDREELGSDYYSGGWNNSQGVREVSKKEYDRIIKDDDISKHEPAIAVCVRKPILNTMKTKTTVTNYPNVGTRKWVTKYEVKDPKHGNVIISELKQADAIKKARALVEKNPDLELTVSITKNLASSSKVAEIQYKKSSKERDGCWDIYGEISY